MQSNFDSDPFSNLVWSDPRTLTNSRQGWFSAPPSEWSKFEALSRNDRVMTNVELRYNPFRWFTHRLATGLDINNSTNSQLWPRQPEGATHVWGNNALGRRDVTRADNRLFSFDYGASAKIEPLTNFVFTTSSGFQYYRRQRASITADGRNFAALPLTSVSAGATLTADESFTENSTVGLFVQQQIDWRNKVFLTGAVRGDDNSAFGAEYDAAIYPKLSGTWVINEESFWPLAWVNQFKLRGAWGAAGQQPGTFDASRLYNPEVGFGDNPVLVPGSYGNPQLKPERSEELEYGFDASMLGGRVELNVTRYSRNIKDAIVNRPVPPSSGFTGSQIVNVAQVKGWGNELGISTQLLNGQKLGWNLGLQMSTMGTRIVTLGDVGNISAGLRFEHREGYPIGGVYVRKVRTATTTATGAVISALCDGGTGPYGADQGGPDVDCAPTTAPNAPRVFIGSSTPTWQVGITNSFSVFKNLKLEARIEGSGGNYNINTEMRASHNNGDTRQVVLLDDQMVNATRQIDNDQMGLYDASFLKLREVSASYTLPRGWLSRLRMTRGTLTVAARNVMMLWTGQHGWSTPRDGRVEQIDGLGDEWTWDPEIRSNSQIGGDYQTVLPPTMSVNVTLRLGF